MKLEVPWQSKGDAFVSLESAASSLDLVAGSSFARHYQSHAGRSGHCAVADFGKISQPPCRRYASENAVTHEKGVGDEY